MQFTELDLRAVLFNKRHTRHGTNPSIPQSKFGTTTREPGLASGGGNAAGTKPTAGDGRRATRLRHELHGDRASDDAFFDASLEKLLDGKPAAVAVVERPIVHVHGNEGVGL